MLIGQLPSLVSHIISKFEYDANGVPTGLCFIHVQHAMPLEL